MPLRLDVKAPGEFVRDHLEEVGEDYVGSIFGAYKAHLRSGGTGVLPSRASFSRLVWILRSVGAIAFSRAEAIAGDRGWQGTPVPADHDRGVAMPSPRHYYTLVDAAHPAFESPDDAYRASRGVTVPQRVARPRVRVQEPPAAPEIPAFTLGSIPGRRAAQLLVRHLRRLERLGRRPEVREETLRLAEALGPWSRELRGTPAELEVERAREALRDQDIGPAVRALDAAFPEGRRARPAAGQLEAQAVAFLERIQELREQPDVGDLEELEADMLALFDRVVDAAENGRFNGAGRADRERLEALAERLSETAPSFESAQAALRTGDLEAYEQAMDALAACCVVPE